MKNIIIVTGGAGFVGSNLIEKLISSYKYKIISIDNYSTGTKKNHINSNLIKYVKGDICDIEKICKGISKNIKVIFHFGEFSRIHQSFSKIEDCFNTNINGTQKIINFCHTNKIKLIYSATSASLGSKGRDKNLSPYAYSKSKNLELILNMRKWFGLSYEILYFYNVYGKRQICKGPMSTVIGIFEDLYSKKKPMTVVKPGTQSRKFTHIDDTIEGCISAWKKNKNREYIVSNSKSHKIIDVAKMFSKKIVLVPERLGERYKSIESNKIQGRKLFKLTCKKELKNYILNFKKGM
jgi:UDP-glucose 4-epimerase